MVGSALVRRLAREDCEVADGRPRDARSAPASARSKPGWRSVRPDAIVAGGREGRRHSRQRHAPGRVSLRQPDDRGQRDRRRPSRRRRASCCFSARPASIRKLAPQPIAEEALLTGPLEPTNEPTRSPRSPASSCAKPIAGNTAAITSRRCRPTSTAPATTSISTPATSCRR